VDLEEAKKAIQKLSPNGLCLSGLLDLKGVASDVVDKVVGAFLLGLFGVSPIGSLVGLVGAGIAEVADKSLRRLLERWGIAKNETIECLRNIVNTAKEASQYIDDERLRGVVEEIAKKWGWDIDTFKRLVKTAAGKSVTEDEVREMIEGALKRIEEELNKVKTEVKGLLVDAKVFFIDDVENGLLYGNFIVEGGVPKIKTQLGTAKNEPEIDLVDTGKFRVVAEDVLSRLTRDGRVVLTGPRGIGKSTLATYVTWRSLLGVLDKPVDAVIRVDSLNPGDAAKLNNLIKTTSRRFIIIYDPSPIEAYYKPETMQKAKHDIESVENTLKELMEFRNAWVVIILPRELYEQVQRAGEGDVDLRRVLDNLERDVVMVNLRDEEFLSEIVKRYSGCGDVGEHLVERIMKFDSYTLIAKYVGVWLRESKCQVKDVDEALRESVGEPKLFFAHYIWSTVLRGNEDLARRVSVPLILHAAFGPIPEGVTYITKAVNEGGVWRLIDRDRLAKSKLEDLREGDLEPIAKWLSTRHEDLIEETLEELVGLRGEEARKQYIDHGFEDFIKALDWGYEKALEEVRGLGNEVKPEKIKVNLLIFVSKRIEYALRLLTNCWKRTALIIGYGFAGYPLAPRLKDLPRDVESLGDALRECGVDDYLLVGNEIPPLILGLIPGIDAAFINAYDKIISEIKNLLNNNRNIYDVESLYGLGLALIVAGAVESGNVEPSDADAALHIAAFAIQRVTPVSDVKSILLTLMPLRDKAPHRYLELLDYTLYITYLHSDTFKYVLKELNNTLNEYGSEVEKHTWSLVHALDAYANLPNWYYEYFNEEEIEHMISKVTDLLDKLDSTKSHLNTIAWAYVLILALMHENVRKHMERKLHINVLSKVEDVLSELDGLLRRVNERADELLSDEKLKKYIESKAFKVNEETINKEILDAALSLKYALAKYRLDNDELGEAASLFRETAERRIKISDYEGYLVDRSWFLRVETIKSQLIDGELVDGFRQLYEDTFKRRNLKPTATYLINASATLGEYLVILALMNNVEEINELLKMHWETLSINKMVSALTRLTLNALLNRKNRLGSELRGKLVVEPKELIESFGYEMHRKFLPALMVAFGVIKLENGIKLCEGLIDDDCIDSVLAVKGNRAAVERLREGLIDTFHKRILEGEVVDLLRELGFDAESLIDEFKRLVDGLNCKSLVQLIAPGTSRAQLALMLYALINGDEKLAKALALYGAVGVSGKLLSRLLLDVYKACEKDCNLNNENLRQAAVKLFLYYI